MNPNQNPNQNQYSIDYLNQISAPAKKPGMSNRIIMILVGVGVLIAIVAGFALLSGGSTSTAKKLETLTARLKTLQTISSKSQATIKSGALRNTNSNLSIFLTNASHDVETPLKNNGISSTNLDKTIVAAESGTDLTKKLEDARLNAIFDRTYAREMSYQLATVASLIREIYNSSNSKLLKTFLLTTDTNLRPIKNQLSDFNAANG
jgi:hypothetical protein